MNMKKMTIGVMVIVMTLGLIGCDTGNNPQYKTVYDFEWGFLTTYKSTYDAALGVLRTDVTGYPKTKEFSTIQSGLDWFTDAIDSEIYNTSSVRINFKETAAYVSNVTGYGCYTSDPPAEEHHFIHYTSRQVQIN
jgi:hypothetical protein